MICKIQRIKSFGIFDDFEWPTTVLPFKKFNLAYGWNYSGKTTLSRALACFEQNMRHPDFPTAQVALVVEDGKTYDLSNAHHVIPICVFNTDFIRKHFFFDTAAAEPVLMLGDTDIAKQADLKAKSDARGALITNISNNTRKKNEIFSAIETGLTRYARDFIKIPLHVPDYDKKRFEPKVKISAKDPNRYLLDDQTLSQSLVTFRSTDKKPTLSSVDNSLSSLSQLTSDVASALSTEISRNKPIPRLVDNPKVESWVQQGRPLHEGQEMCQFCGQKLPTTLLDDLASHFSVDYENLMEKLSALITQGEMAQKETITICDEARFYPDLSEKVATHKKTLESLLSARRSALDALLSALIRKQTKAFTSLECPLIKGPALEITATVAAINGLIGEHNARTDKFESVRDATLRQIELHYAALFVGDLQYNDKLDEIDNLRVAIENDNKKVRDLDDNIRDLERDLSEAARGAGRINELLEAYFGRKDLQIAVSSENKFKILRGGNQAKNLSEGEKTAIAFAFFITRVQDGRTPIKDTIVVIDDPISSLDANHLFNTYALIKTQLADCNQLFVLTHNFEFYNLIRDWASDDKEDLKKPQKDWKKWGIFIVKRTDSGEGTIENIPRELVKFRSEYHYLFSILHEFKDSGTASFDGQLGLPNIVRRFLEAFGGIMIPVSNGLKGKLPRIFSDEVERERVWKFVNHYSHNTTITRSLTIPDISECRTVVEICLKAVQTWDAEYYKDLETEIS